MAKKFSGGSGNSGNGAKNSKAKGRQRKTKDWSQEALGTPF